MTKREKTRDLFIELINTQLEPHGVTYEDVKGMPQWYMQYKTTKEKEDQFIDHAIQRIMKVLKISKTMATKEAHWFILQWGLTIQPEEYKEPTKNQINKNARTL